MAKVKIVYVPDAARRGPDLTRIGTVEDIPDEIARVMVTEGSAVWPTPDELASPDRPDAAEEPDTDDGPEEDLMALTRAQLLDRVPDGVTVPAGATKADLIGLIRGPA